MANNIIWNSSSLEKALGVAVAKNIEISGKVTYDSRLVKKGDLFVCLKFSSIDTHKYADHATQMGARAVIAENTIFIKESDKDKIILVNDSEGALWKMAKYKRINSKATFIAVTGSVGKTSTKDSIKTILEPFGETYASEKNQNNQIGLPLSLASMPDNAKFAIFEAALRRYGDIMEITKLLRPDIGVLTCMEKSHLTFFYNMEDLINAKCELLYSLPEDGKILFYNDHKYTRQIEKNISAFPKMQKYSYGTSKKDASASLEEYKILDSSKVALSYDIEGVKFQLQREKIQRHHAINYSGALLVAKILGLDVAKAAKQIARIKVPEGRGNIATYQNDSMKISCICDHYNANPASMRAALEDFRIIKHNQKTLILADMLDLSQESEHMHLHLMPHILKSGAYKIILVGKYFKILHDKIVEEESATQTELRHFKNVDDLLKNIKTILKDGDMILLKGSNGMNLKKILDYLENSL